jgi:hypothetical protein
MIPYTYLIGWAKLKKFYYGCRYSKKCDPTDLWTTYFTSSSRVKSFREENGDPDIIQIRKIFTSGKECRDWEHKVLRRLKVYYNEKWINISTGGGKFIGVTRSGWHQTDEAKRIIGEKSRERQRNQTPESKQKSAQKRKETCESRWICTSDYLPSFKGKHHRQESKDLIAIGHIGKPNPGSAKNIGKKWWNNGFKNSFSFEPPNDTYVLGKLPSSNYHNPSPNLSKRKIVSDLREIAKIKNIKLQQIATSWWMLSDNELETIYNKLSAM